MVERSITYRLQLHEFDRWAGTLQENALQDELAPLLTPRD